MTPPNATSAGITGIDSTEPCLGDAAVTASTVAATAYPTTLAEAAARGEHHPSTGARDEH